MGVREEKKRETRARLERAAFDLFAERGYDETTVDEVASRGGVSARTVFRYFPAKADLVFGDAAADLTTLRAHLAGQDQALPALAAIRIALSEFSQQIGTWTNAERIRLIERNPTLMARSLAERELWAEAIAAELAARRGLGAPDERARLGGLLVISILVSALRDWAGPGGDSQNLREAVDRTAGWAAEMLQS
jgi:TetR/AcrR family transcriptional regulator, regulator of mycofactocin system